VQAGTHREALRQVADRLCAEFTDPEATELPGIRSSLSAEERMTETLDTEDEALVTHLRDALAGIASTLSAGTEQRPVQATATALDGAEFVIRRALAAGETERVLTLMPSFVFLVALSVADRDRALELSERTTELTEELAP
jgi:hypothetical protein